MTRLKNQSPFTQTADVGGENGLVGSGKLEGMEGRDPFGWVEDC
jgi:hypothetical protein